MNLVGQQGKGESVWLGFFLYDVLMQFTAIARRAMICPLPTAVSRKAARLRQQLEQQGWDGEWYRRA